MRDEDWYGYDRYVDDYEEETYRKKKRSQLLEDEWGDIEEEFDDFDGLPDD